MVVCARAQTPDSFNPTADNSVLALAVQNDGKILAGGLFSMLGGVGRSYLGRLNYDGSPDNGFNPGADGQVYCLAVQPDGKILVGGTFGTLSGQPCDYLGRLNANGTLDSTFDSGISSFSFGYVYSLAVQADGKILAGGTFTTLGGQSCKYIGRINTDGTLDTNFNAGAGSAVYCLAAQPDGRVVVGGNFSSLSGQPCANLGRLNPDGSFDTNFLGGASSYVNCLAIQADGKILVGGNFTTLGNQACTNLGRLNADGTFDPTFYYGADGPVYSLAVETDGRIIVSGSFATLGGLPCANLGRVNANGTLDGTFNPGTDSTVFALTIQPDGGVLVGGAFTNLAGQLRPFIGRLSNTVATAQSLAAAGSTITWLRSGPGPEAWRTTFESSTDGTDWVELGNGTRIAGGWQLTNVSVPPNASLRARGFVAAGERNGSGWFAENIVGPAVITGQPMSQTNNAGTVASFSVLAGGTAPLSYQWSKDGVALNDSSGIKGSQTATITISNVLGGNAGGYLVVVTNASGSATSMVATLTVIDPVITSQPAGQELNAGLTAVFSVTATGTMPLAYQWRKNTTNYIAGGNTASLTLTNLQASDAGSYDVVVSNVIGAVTSTPAVLIVDVATLDSFNPAPNSFVYSLALQADGRILAGGAFTNLAGLTCKSVGRLNADGSLDTNFLGSANSSVYCFAVQPDGKILVGGSFTSLDGQTVNRLGRLNPDGSLETNFLGGAGGTINSLALQPDGKIVVGGGFATLGGLPCSNLGRLNSDGTLDTNFIGSANSTVYSLALQPDGKVLVAGGFSTLSGQSHAYLGRLNSDGSLDTNFTATANSFVVSLALQADGRILAGGNFSLLAGFSRSHVGRINTNGTIDTGFNPGANNYVVSMAVQADGKIIAGGNFNMLGGLSRSCIGRLNPDGSVDTTFNPGATTYVYGLALQSDGKILAGGQFTTFGGQARNYLARLINSPLPTQTLTCDGSTVTWQRSGTAPEVWRTTFESSTDGINWSSLGSGSRITGGWQLSGLSVPGTATIRARGYIAGGYWNGSGWFVQSTAPVTVPVRLAILVNDGNFGIHSNGFGFNVASLPGQVVVIEASTNLVTWTPILTNVTTGTGLISFRDPQFSLFAHRFYRARVYNGSLPPPSILSGSNNGLGFQGGMFGFSLSGIGGQTVVVQASTNLVTWVPLSTNTLGNAPLYFSDPASTNFPWRFYRARVQ